MGKTSKWIKHFLIGKKDKDKQKTNSIVANYEIHEVVNGHPTTPVTVPLITPPAKDKKRWSFRRSSATAPPPSQQPHESESEHQKPPLEMAPGTGADVATAKDAAVTMDLTLIASDRVDQIEEYAAIKIQSFYRGYLSRKALNALRGLVKLQALVRGHLVRKQAIATLRCMQALITVQSRARAQRLHVLEDSKSYNDHKQFNHRKSAHEFRRHSYQDVERGMEENEKIVEMDPGYSKPNIISRSNYSSQGNGQIYPFDHIISPHKTSSKHDHQPSPSPSAITELSPRTSSGHFEDYSFNTAQSSPQYYPKIPTNYETSYYSESNYSEYPPFYPSYMANTQSSRAKVRSQSAPKTRPEVYERQNSGRRRPSIEGRNVPRGVKMQRSASQVAAAAQNYQYPWSVKLDNSTVSVKDSECGSTSTVISNAYYCRSLVGFEVHGNRY